MKKVILLSGESNSVENSKIEQTEIASLLLK